MTREEAVKIIQANPNNHKPCLYWNGNSWIKDVNSEKIIVQVQGRR